MARIMGEDKTYTKTRISRKALKEQHKEVMVDDNSGMITRRIGSPSGTDEWHYHERFIGAIQKKEKLNKKGGQK